MAAGMMGILVTLGVKDLLSCASTATAILAERLRHQPRQLHAESQHHAGFQFVDLSASRYPGTDPMVARLANGCEFAKQSRP